MRQRRIGKSYTHARDNRQPTTTCAIYARVSTRDRQETQNQIIQLREFCERQGWNVVHEFVDRESGAVAERTEFQKMLVEASRCNFEVLLFWSLDRLTREGTLATLQYLERLTSYHVGYKSYTEPYLDSCGTFKDVVISLLATMAKQERIRIGERVRAGLHLARSRGQRLGRPPRRMLTQTEIRKLRRERAEFKTPYRNLAEKWGVTIFTAHTLCSGKHSR